MAEPDVLPRVLSGRYRLEATLGVGGMGVVYRGTDLTTKRPVAVKLVRSVDGVPLDEEVAGRFLREAKNTARLHHDHIIEVLDLGRTDGFGLYFVMELLEGESLAARLRREKKLSPVATVQIVRQICEALEVAHEAGVIHRDLKPANIMLLRRAGRDDFVKVLDFGVAKSFGPNKQQDETQLTHTGMLVGTIDYMAPEQIMGKPVDGRTDVYSIGVMLYRMLAGQAPFKDNGLPSLINSHLNQLPKPLMEVTEGIPTELNLVVLRCMMKKPERRYESMAELSRALVHAVPAAEMLPALEDGDGDVYAEGDKTTVGRSLSEALGNPAPPAPRPAPMLNDETVNHMRVEDPIDELFDDATVKIDRPFVLTPGQIASVGLPVVPRGARPPSKPPVRVHEQPVDSSRGPRVCAMCQTVNAPHANACAACGVSLANTEQDAVRQRVAPNTIPVPGTERMPASVPQPAPYHPPNIPYNAMPFGVPNMQPMPMPQPPLPLAPPPRSMWQRFLSWTGLRR